MALRVFQRFLKTNWSYVTCHMDGDDPNAGGAPHGHGIDALGSPMGTMYDATGQPVQPPNVQQPNQGQGPAQHTTVAIHQMAQKPPSWDPQHNERRSLKQWKEEVEMWGMTCGLPEDNGDLCVILK